MRYQEGFSLIELLIVVAIIIVIAAIAVPNLLRARIAANEAAAAESLRIVNTAEISYVISYPTVGYSSNLRALGNPGNTNPCRPSSSHACIIDSVLGNASTSPGKSGYLISETGIAVPNVATYNSTYRAGAAPVSYNISGVKAFCTTEDGVVRVDYRNTNGKDKDTVAYNACVQKGGKYSAIQ